jgi:hypothetical protein
MSCPKYQDLTCRDSLDSFLRWVLSLRVWISVLSRITLDSISIMFVNMLKLRDIKTDNNLRPRLTISMLIQPQPVFKTGSWYWTSPTHVRSHWTIIRYLMNIKICRLHDKSLLSMGQKIRLVISFSRQSQPVSKLGLWIESVDLYLITDHIEHHQIVYVQ